MFKCSPMFGFVISTGPFLPSLAMLVLGTSSIQALCLSIFAWISLFGSYFFTDTSSSPSDALFQSSLFFTNIAAFVIQTAAGYYIHKTETNWERALKQSFEQISEISAMKSSKKT